MAISHALAQSTKLSVYEERVVALVEESRHLPQDLANHGRVSMPTRKLAQLIGKVFLQSSNVNLLSTVLDTPEFFWSAPDHLQVWAVRINGRVHGAWSMEHGTWRMARPARFALHRKPMRHAQGHAGYHGRESTASLHACAWWPWEAAC